ncbi:Histidine kinase-, DNA gyrase B-, and HSP90-like ATPase [Lutibacter oricola]|uniref:histidine kinase n=1 Tax=Lutibacter oricola TaxID=762486 RepID=A0A1H3EEJ5_9FLAO|nr:HAMP domain-containing sensor histidine kinase [Lutibacter oricola]SDX77047.1 Histidine kinase-, DNA gyrase B-, and HSP90-like ATPase [Lutibacter oricola]
MATYKNIHIVRWVLITLSFIIVTLILWNTFTFFQKFKTEERIKMELVAAALEEINANKDLDARIELPLNILSSNKSIPMVLVLNKDSITGFNNLDPEKALKKDYLKKQVEIMKNENTPISIKSGNNTQTIYYRNSDLLNKLKYYPLTLLIILFLFAAVIFLFFKSNKIAEQNKLWTGMAKETAHQIGTPLSSLLGWIEILKLEDTDPNTVSEIENDVHRLNTIAERFSKIGSIPVLKNENVVDITKTAFNYLQSRSSKQVHFNFNSDSTSITSAINQQLFSWVIENLVKNAIDAMEGKGYISLKISENPKNIAITITDTGKGISKNLQQKIFTPGYTTKKRGWGLGLSLAKRIIEDYHNGKIGVLNSELGKGTTFKITLKKAI